MTDAEAKRPSDSLAVPLEPTDRLIADLVPVSHPPGKWAAINAIRHLHRAWLIREADPEMAVFRSITAEEESATAVFLALKRLNYPGAKRLDRHSHLHKNALFPFSHAIADFFSKVSPHPFDVEAFVDAADAGRIIRVRFSLPVLGTAQQLIVVTKAPLHFQLREGVSGKSEGKLVDFAGQALALAEQSGFRSVMDYLRDRANWRNRLLYAGGTGYPQVGGDLERALTQLRSRTFANLLTFLMIDQHDFKQHFAKQALASFLRLLKLVPPDVEFD